MGQAGQRLPPAADSSGQRFPAYDDWKQVYAGARDSCDFAAALQFLRGRPGATNNRGGGSESTLLHQAVFWGVDAGVIRQLRDLGADPTVMNKQGQTPLDLARSPAKRREMEAVFSAEFGDDDARLRQEVLQEAKGGNFLRVMHFLRQRPYLVNTQSLHSGWSVMHQMAYHGGSAGLVTALSDLGASWDLRTHEGKTPAGILAETHPRSSLSIPAGRVPRSFQVGQEVFWCGVSGRGKAQVMSVSGDQAEVRMAHGAASPRQVAVPVWRLAPIRTSMSEAELASSLGAPCAICSEVVPPDWRVSAACADSCPVMCTECTAMFFWSQFTSSHVPIQCSGCSVPVNLAQLPPWLRRSIAGSCWPPGLSYGNPCTQLSWDDFVGNVQQKVDDHEQADNGEYKLRMLQQCGTITVAYVDTPAPEMRACPQCGVLITYGGACKHFSCTMCQHRFCWLCLRSPGEHNTPAFHWSHGHACPVQGVQTAIPHAGAAQ